LEQNQLNERSDTYAYFWVEGLKGSIDEFIERIGVSPTDVSLKDSLLAGDRVQKESVWRVFSP
jgi:hypothetical protein